MISYGRILVLSKNNIFDKIPLSLISHILEMNPEHRENFKKMSLHIKIGGVLSTLSYIYKCNDRDITDIDLEKQIPDIDHFIETLYLCDCCDRHKNKKPISRMNAGCFDLNFFNDIDKLINCHCLCRHESRKLYKLNKR
jgi:hypothetical protein